MSNVRDRLPELQALTKSSKNNDKWKGSPKSKKKNRGAGDMQVLQEQVRAVEAKLTTLKRNVEDVDKLQKTLLNSPFCEKQDVYKYDQTVKYVQQVSDEIRKELRSMEAEGTEEKKSGDTESALHRVRTQQLNRLTNTLASLTNTFFKSQAEYMDKMKGRMKTQLEVTQGTGDISEEEVNEILQKDNYSAFTQNFINDTQDAESQLRQIEDRQNEILALEKSVFEVNQLFKDMSVLVHDQGETLDNIEANITTAGSHVVEGNVKLKQAKKHRTRGRRMKFCIAGIILVVVIIVAIVLIVQFA